MFIVSLHYVKPLSDIDPLLERHIMFLRDQYTKGIFMFSGPKIPRTGGVIVARCESRDALQAVLKEDPFYQAEVAEYEIVEFIASMTAAPLKDFQEK